MRCLCTSKSTGCPADRIKVCDPGVQHCFLTIKWDEVANRFVETLQDCWLWTDKQKCPEQSGFCHILQESENETKTCCCMGELCNNATDVQFVSSTDYLPGVLYNPDYNAVSLLNRLESTSTSRVPVYAVSSKAISVALPMALLLFIIICGALFIHICRNRLRTVYFKQHFRESRQNNLCSHCHSMKTGSSFNCACEHFGLIPGEMQPLNGMPDAFRFPAVGSGWLTDDEVEGLASRITKMELKSQGCFGQVWHGQLKPGLSDKLSGISEVAVKIFRQAQKESWDTELEVFRVPGLPHPNILKYYGADQLMNSQFEPPELEFWLVTEYHSLGSLHDYLKTHTLNWFELLRLAIGIARGLSHLHSETVGFTGASDLGAATATSSTKLKRIKPSIAHRDLNSRNVVVKSDLTACIADFGLAIRFESGQLPSVAHPQLGTRRYMAPEVLDGAIQFSRDAYLRIDVYAMGLVFWELMSRCHGTDDCQLESISPYRAPFELELGPTPSMADLERYVAHEKQRPKFNPVWASYSPLRAFWETVEECWDQDAEARLSAGCVTERLSSLLRQPWSGSVTSHGQFPNSSPQSILPMLPSSASPDIRSDQPNPSSRFVTFPVPSASVSAIPH